MSNEFTQNDLEVIQTFMSENITATKPMTSVAIFSAVKTLLSKEFQETVFKSQLSISVNTKKITGFVGKRKIGYCKAEDKPVETDDDAEENSEPELNASEEEPDDGEIREKFTVKITDRLRVTVLDKRNIGLQVLSGSVWHTETYHTSLENSFRAASKFLLKKGMTDAGTYTDLSHCADILTEIEQNILKAICTLPKETNDRSS